VTSTGSGRFHFRGPIPASKSILNRLLIIQSFAESLVINGDSDADDVVKMRNGLRQVLRGEPADCGAAGTTLRFLALRASRLEGTHHLSGSLRLFERPQTEISRLLTQLDCEAEIRLQRLTVRGDGWQKPTGDVVIDRSISSQFASALFLNAWNLPFDLRVHFVGEAVSESYLAMTLELLRRAGMKLEKIEDASGGGTYIIRAESKVTAHSLSAEPDASSAFALAATGVARAGVVEIEQWPTASLQPDAIFPDLLRSMNCEVSINDGVLRLERDQSVQLAPLDFNLRDAPDLFPVLAVLCSLANGRSRLYGAPHLAHKESDRIGKIGELIKCMGRKVRVLPDGLEIDGQATSVFPGQFKFSTDHDHRLAMAAAVAKAAGAEIEIQEPKVVDKSFPGFWQAIESGTT
jgi:3-phosphoshikimate 1-carboxyvinyltransferase